MTKELYNYRLLTPGPVSIRPEISLSMAAPLIHHREKTFLSLFGQAAELLRKLAFSSNYPLFFSSSGTGVMESAVVNVFSPGDRVLVINTGVFGARFAKIARAYGLDLVELVFPLGRAAQPSEILDRIVGQGNFKGCLFQFSDTSTAVMNPVVEICQALKQRVEYFIVDGVSGFLTAPFEFDKSGVDLFLTASQKALGAAPGVGIVYYSSKIRDYLINQGGGQISRFYFSYNQLIENFEKGIFETPFTPAISTIQGIHQAALAISDSKVEKFIDKHYLMARMVWSAVEAMGLTILNPLADRARGVTVINLPGSNLANKVKSEMMERFNLQVAGGQLELAGKVIRIGHMGFIDPVDILGVIAVLEILLAENSVIDQIGSGLIAAQKVLAGR